jgi:hypothetical protein
MMRAMLSAAALVVVGCQSVDDIRSAPPVVVTVAAPWQAMLACFTEKFLAVGASLTPVIRPAESRATLLAINAVMGPAPMWEVTFQGVQEGGTRLEHRDALPRHMSGRDVFRRIAAECEAQEAG